MTVTKRKIAKKIAKNIQINESESLAIANGFFEIIKSNLAQHIVKISGFGSFHRTITVQRIGRNPKTKEKKEISKSKDESLFKKSKEISIELEKISENQKKTKIKLDEILSNIPNIPNFDVPDGKDENDNVEVLKSGEITEFDFEPNLITN